MEEFGLKLNLLADILDKKTKALEQILNITENQRIVLEQPSDEGMIAMFNEMALEKQKHVDVVLNADTFFQSVFNDIKQNFDELAQSYLDKIKELQDRIRRVMDLDVAIRVREERNKELLPEARIKKIPKTVNKNYILEQYAKNNKHE